ncbi:MAG: FHA domain-containing protein [Pseudomonadota bacterium]
MALLLDTARNQTHPIRVHHVVGRDINSVDTPLPSQRASRLHASFIWADQRWMIKDLSRNGTWLRGKRMPSGASVAINAGDELRFGGSDDGVWRFVDDAPPQSLLLGLSSQTEDMELSSFLILPNEDQPTHIISFQVQQACWICQELDERLQPASESVLKHGEILTCGDTRWRVFLADSTDVTEIVDADEGGLEDLEFVFDLSLDEENTALKLNHDTRSVNLGERSHHYLLLHLARQRALEAMDGLDAKNQGWLDTEQLAKDLGVEMTHINIMIFRARKQIAQALVGKVNSELLVERGRGRVRCGFPRFKIYKGEELTYRLPLAETASAQDT